MKKMKIFSMSLFIIFTLTGCFIQEKPVNNTLPNNSAVNSTPNNVQTVTIKPKKALKPINETPKPKVTLPQ